MKQVPPFRRALLAVFSGLFGLTLAVSAATPPVKPAAEAASVPAALKPTSDRTFVSSPALATEARALVKILEEAHYNRDAVRTADFAEVIPDYMKDLDQQHMIF